MSRADALSLAEATFADTVGGPAWSGPNLRPGERIKRYLDDHRFEVEAADGKRRFLVVSQQPVLAEVEGREQPVDMSLEPAASGALEPSATPTPVALGATAGDGVTLGHSDLTMRAVGSGEAPRAEVAQKAFYANTDTDTDFIAAPEADGVETFFELRSADSPSRLAIDFSKPGASTTVELEHERVDGSPPTIAARIVSGGQSLATVAPPAAWDADGEPVPISYSAQGSQLQVHVDHAGGDYHYPIMVDPYVREDQTGLGAGDVGASGGYWESWTWLTDRLSFGTGTDGLVILGGYDHYYWAGDYGEWRLRSYPNTRIVRVDFDRMIHLPGTATCADLMILASVGGGAENAKSFCNPQPSPGTIQTVCADVANPCGTNNSVDGNVAVLRLRFTSTGPLSGAVFASLKNAYIYYYENHAPTATAGFNSGPPTQWVDDYSGSFQVHGVDAGLGLARWYAQFPGLNEYVDVNECPMDTWRHTCFPTDRWSTRIWNFRTNTWPQGSNNISVAADDRPGNFSGWTNYPLKVDHQSPTLSDTGPLKDAVNDYPGPNADLHVVATDGYSGVQSVEIKVDDQVKQTWTNGTACDGCGIDKHWTWHDADYGPGPHHIKVTATDFTTNAPTEHKTIDEWDVTTDDVAPDVDIDGSLWDADGGVISAPTYDLSIDAGDGDPDDPGVGVKSIVISVDGQVAYSAPTQTCPAGNCAMPATWQFQTANYSDGPHNVSIDVTDQTGNVTTDDLSVTVANITPLASDTRTMDSSITQLVFGAQGGDQAGQSVADVGDLNADGRDDYAIGSPGALVTTTSGVPARPTAGKVQVVYGTPTGAPWTDLSNFPSASGFTISGAAALDRCGSAVAAAGDVNGDGYDDMLVGCPATDGSLTAPPARGHVYVLWGGPARTDVDLSSLGAAGFQITGPSVPAGAFTVGARAFGSYLSGPRGGTWGLAADVNDDGLDDISIGSSTDSSLAGSTYVVFGKSGTAAVDVTALGAGGFTINGAATGDRSGYAAAIVGDVNGDDYADIAVTSPSANASGRTTGGTAYVVYGKPDTTSVNLSALGAGGFAVYGDDGDKIGSSVASIGDIDADSLADFAVGGHGAFVVRGHDTTDAVDFRTPDFGYKLTAPADITYDNSIVAGGGDLNDDALPDVLVGFPKASGTGGTVFAVLSQAGLEPSSAAIDLSTLPGQQGTRLYTSSTGAAAGTSLDGVEQGPDGQPALILGTPGYSKSATAPQSGAASVIPASKFKANASSAGAPKPIQCWKKHLPYPGDHPFRDALVDFPRVCRWTRHENLDRTWRGQAGGFKGGSKGLRRPFGGNLNKHVRRGHRLNDFAKTELIDSDGKTLGYLQQSKKPHDRFTFYDAAGANPVSRRNLRIRMEGTPCMTTNHYPGLNVLISLQGADKKSVKTSNSPLAGMRGIVKRTAFSEGSFSKQYTNDQVIDSGWLSCHKPAHYRKLDRNSSQTYTSGPGFQSSEQYLGSNAAQACINDRNRYPTGQKDPNCGTSYIDYVFPRDTSFSTFPETALLSESTTGVGRGGKIRGLLKIGSGLQLNKFDSIDYLDPNVPCESYAVAKWILVGTGGMRGWWPRRQAGGAQRTGSFAGC